MRTPLSTWNPKIVRAKISSTILPLVNLNLSKRSYCAFVPVVVDFFFRKRTQERRWIQPVCVWTCPCKVQFFFLYFRPRSSDGAKLFQTFLTVDLRLENCEKYKVVISYYFIFHLFIMKYPCRKLFTKSYTTTFDMDFRKYSYLHLIKLPTQWSANFSWQACLKKFHKIFHINTYLQRY